MTDFTTLQVFGVPVLTYGLIGLTTGVLAYATSIGMGGSVSKSMESISEITANPMGALADATPPTTPDEPPVESTPDSGIAGLTPVAPEPTPEKTGGKRRRRKTPKSKSRKNRKTRVKK